MDGGDAGEPGDETAGGVHAAAAVDALLDEGDIGTAVKVEGRAAPMAARLGRFFLHREDAVGVVDRRDTGLAEFLLRRFEIPHDAGRPLLPGVPHELYETEIQEVVSGDDEEVVVQPERVDGELDVAHGTEAGVVGGGAVVQDGHACRRPVLEDGRELVVGNDDILIHEAGGIDVVDEPVQDGFVPDFQEGFGEVFGEGVEPRGVAGGEDEAFHRLKPSAESQR